MPVDAHFQQYVVILTVVKDAQIILGKIKTFEKSGKILILMILKMAAWKLNIVQTVK